MREGTASLGTPGVGPALPRTAAGPPGVEATTVLQSDLGWGSGAADGQGATSPQGQRVVRHGEGQVAPGAPSPGPLHHVTPVHTCAGVPGLPPAPNPCPPHSPGRGTFLQEAAGLRLSELPRNMVSSTERSKGGGQGGLKDRTPYPHPPFFPGGVPVGAAQARAGRGGWGEVRGRGLCD